MKITFRPHDMNLGAAAGADHLLTEIERLQRENDRLRKLLAWRTRQDAATGSSQTKH